MRVLIYEPDFGGHHLQYVRAILDALTFLPVTTTLVCERGVRDGDEFTIHLAAIRHKFELDDAVPTMRGKPAYAVGVHRLLELRKAIKRHKPDHVYIPYADGLIQVAGAVRPLGLSFSRPGMETEALMMRGKFAYDTCPVPLRTRMMIRASQSAPVDIVHHLDPIVYDYLGKHFSAFAARLRLIPEAVEPMQPIDVRSARMQLGIDPDGRYFGCLGALSAVKGTAQLLTAFSNAALAADVRLLLVGKADSELRLLLQGEHRTLLRTGRIVHIDRYVSQDEFHLGIVASDVVCAPYLRQIGSSGIVVRAAAAGRVLLGSDYGWVGRVIREFELGVACDIADPVRLSAAMAEALDRSVGYRPGPNALSFANFHSIDNFGSHWTRRLRQRLGMETSGHLTAWEWPLRS